jgi:hypothetical protein
MTRRGFLQHAVVGALAPVLAPALRGAAPAAGPRILLREALQFENIGDSGRVPGTLRLFYEHLPDAEVTLWPWHLHERERALLRRTFPRLHIAEGEIDTQGRPSSPDLAAAWERATIFVSPSKNAATYRDWARTGRPYGLFGSAFDPITNRTTRPEGDTLDELAAAIDRLPADDFDRKFGSRALYERAAFIYCRDRLSLRYLQRQQLRPPVLDFGPEGCFAIAVRDDARADAWRQRHGLAADGYLCVVPRLRYTPYYRVRNLPREKSDVALDTLNARTSTADHAPLRELITLWVRHTGLKVVACPEMTYQIETAREQLVDPLPEEIRRHVVWRDEYWLPDEAAALYAHARAVVSIECHSPIIALAHGTPMLHVRQPVDTVKAHMFRDLGLGDWVFEVGATSGAQLWETLRPLHENLPAARARVRDVLRRVAEIQRGMTLTLGRAATTLPNP